MPRFMFATAPRDAPKVNFVEFFCNIFQAIWLRFNATFEWACPTSPHSCKVKRGDCIHWSWSVLQATYTAFEIVSIIVVKCSFFRRDSKSLHRLLYSHNICNELLGFIFSIWVFHDAFKVFINRFKLIKLGKELRSQFLLLFALLLVTLSKAICKIDLFLFSLLDDFHLLGHEVEVKDHFFHARLVRVLLVSKVNEDFFGYRIWELHHIVLVNLLFIAILRMMIFIATVLALLNFIFDRVKWVNCLCHVCVFCRFCLFFAIHTLEEVGAKGAIFFGFLFNFKLQNCATYLDVSFLAWDYLHWLLKDFQCAVLWAIIL